MEVRMLLSDFLDKRFDILERDFESEKKIQRHEKNQQEIELRENKVKIQVLNKEISLILKVRAYFKLNKRPANGIYKKFGKGKPYFTRRKSKV